MKSVLSFIQGPRSLSRPFMVRLLFGTQLEKTRNIKYKWRKKADQRKKSITSVILLSSAIFSKQLRCPGNSIVRGERERRGRELVFAIDDLRTTGGSGPTVHISPISAFLLLHLHSYPFFLAQNIRPLCAARLGLSDGLVSANIFTLCVVMQDHSSVVPALWLFASKLLCRKKK